jgi:plastocyanin
MRPITILAALAATFALSAGTAAAKAPQASFMIWHNEDAGCHVFAPNATAAAKQTATKHVIGRTLRIRKGARVSFLNYDVEPHKVVQTSGPRHVRVSLLTQGKRIVSPKFTKAGRYVFHSKMTKDQMPDDSTMTYRIIVS